MEYDWQEEKAGQSVLLPQTETEVKMGYAVDAYVQQNFVFLDDETLQQRIDEMGHRLLQATPSRNIAYRFRVINHNDLNAFSVPGGFIYITYGMLRLAQTENEVAGLLAHEIAHVEHRHHMKNHRSCQALSAVLNSTVLGLSMMGGTAGNGTQYASNLGPLAALVTLNTFRRSQETQADDYAVFLMEKAGFNPHGLSQILRRIYLEKDRKDELAELPSIFMTHPPNPSRIDRIENKIIQMYGPKRRAHL